MFRLNGIVAGAIALSMVSAAGAATLTGSYNPSLTQSVALDVVGWIPSQTNALNTRKFNWNRSDLPAGAGVDTLISASFVGYCVEINQSVDANTSTTYTVLSGGAIPFSPNQIVLFSRLWGSFESSVVSGITSAAFQCAIYEIVFDADGAGLNQTTGNFKLQNLPENAAVAAQLQTYLTGIQNVAAVQFPIAILQSPNSQDQIVRVPTPGTATVGLVGAGLIARRRRRN